MCNHDSALGSALPALALTHLDFAAGEDQLTDKLANVEAGVVAFLKVVEAHEVELLEFCAQDSAEGLLLGLLTGLVS